MKAIPGTLVSAAVAVVAASLLALAGVWLLGALQAAGEDYLTDLHIDLDVTGNGPNMLTSDHFCIEFKNPGDTFEIDVTLLTIPPGRGVGGFEYSLLFDPTRLKITAQNHDMLLGFAEGSVIVDGSEAVPDTTSPHMVTVSDYTAPEDEFNGVLGRYTVELLADAPSGLTTIDLAAPLLLDGEGVPISIKQLLSGMIGIGAPCPTPVPLEATQVAPPTPMPSPTSTPMLEPTLAPTLAPTVPPTLGPTIAPTLAPTPILTPSPVATATPLPSLEAMPAQVGIPRAPPPTGVGQTNAGGGSIATYGLLALGGVAILAGLLTLVRHSSGRTG